MRTLALLTPGLAAATFAPAQGFVDTFDTINPAWVTDRYEPHAFTVVNDGIDNRLNLEINSAESFNQRPANFQSNFYNRQGRQRAANISDILWQVSVDLEITQDMLAGPNLRDASLWARTDAVSENDAYYPIFGFERVNSADRREMIPANANTSRWWFFNPNDGAVTFSNTNLTLGWHNLMINATATDFEYSIDGAVLATYARDFTVSQGLKTVFLQGYNFSNSTNDSQNYSIHFDNAVAQAVPEPASMAVLGLGALGLLRRRKNQSKN